MMFVRFSTVISVRADLYANPQTTRLEIVFRRLLFRTNKASLLPVLRTRAQTINAT